MKRPASRFFVLMLCGFAVVFWAVSQWQAPVVSQPSFVLKNDSSPEACRACATEPKTEAVATPREVAPVFGVFAAWAQQYRAAGPAQRAMLASAGVELAKERRPRMLALIQNDPEAALQQALPRVTQRALPPQIQALLEEQLSAEGVLSTAISTPLDRRDAPRTERLIDTRGRMLHAHTYGRRNSRAFDNKQISVHGVILDSHMAVSDSPLRRVEPGEVEASVLDAARAEATCPVSGVAIAAANDSTPVWMGSRIVYLCMGGHIVALDDALVGQESAPDIAASAWTEGTKTILYITVKFLDQANDPVKTNMDQVAKFMRENSVGKTDFVTTFTPVYTLSKNTADYASHSDVYNEARALALAGGLDYTRYNLDCVYYNGGPGGFAGLASVGGRGCWLKDNGPTVAAHEFGHNLGLWHANFWLTTDGSSIGAGADDEYGNPFDVMGESWDIDRGHFNTYEKNLLNWVPNANVSTAAASGTFRIYAHDLNVLRTENKYALKVDKDGDRVYWLDYRQHAEWSSNRWLVNGVSVHWDRWANSNNGSELLDVHPATTDRNDSPLVIGETFSDTQAHLHFTVVARGGEAPDNWIDVVFNKGPFPNNAAPTLALSSSPLQVYVYDPVTLSANAADANADTLAFHWDLDGEFGPNVASVTRTWNTPGTRTVTCTVTDMKGGKSTQTLAIEVLPPLPDNGIGLQAQYFDNADLTAPVLTRIDPNVNYDYGMAAPATGVGADSFSIRWSGMVKPQYTEEFTFFTRTDDGARLWVDGQLLVDRWVNQGATERSGKIKLTRNRKVRIVMEYYDGGGAASAQLSWSSASVAKAIIPQSQLFPPNTAPVLASALSALPNPADPEQIVSFSAGASDGDADELVYTWDFGDGSTLTGANPGHAYFVPGTYTASVLVDDTYGGTVQGSVTVVVNPYKPGHNPTDDFDGDGAANAADDDDDNDGAPDSGDDERFTVYPFTVLKLQGKLSFKAANKDGISLQGVFKDVPALFDPSGQTLSIDFGGVPASFTFNAKGQARNATAKAQLKMKTVKNKATKKKEFKGGDVALRIQIKGGSWSDEWADEGVNPAASSANTALSMPITLIFGGKRFAATPELKYSSKAGTSGKFKK